MADADRLVAALRYQQELEDASRPATVNPLMARKAEAIKQNAPAENMLTQYAETMPQNWQQFGQNMAQSYPTPATGASREQILGAVTQAGLAFGSGNSGIAAARYSSTTRKGVTVHSLDMWNFNEGKAGNKAKPFNASLAAINIGAGTPTFETDTKIGRAHV